MSKFPVNSVLLIPVFLILGFTSKDGSRVADFNAYSQKIPGAAYDIDMVPIPAGKFLMGSPSGEAGRKPDEGPQHPVNISAFWMGKYEITWQQYELFRQRKIDNENGGYVRGKEIDFGVDAVSEATAPYIDMSFGMGKDGYPVINITQLAAATFCKWLSAKTGQFYRLPTEAEWEYACRAGTKTNYSFGNDASKIGDYGWFYDNSDDKYQKIGQKKPNPWGLHDMHGNVAEWTLDEYAEKRYDTYANKTSTDPWSKAVKLYPRVVRGGSWYDDPSALRSAARQASNKNWKRIDPQIPKSLWWHTSAPFLGFRIVRPVETPTKEEIKKYWPKPIEQY
ncbi:MAG: sulfatase activating formylglycine-generating enzyme [Cyclobacteriaceae bacterium]|jgi:formylglycine-generating enzyme required for sulfatase activity